MADSNSVTPGLATLGANGWTAAAPPSNYSGAVSGAGNSAGIVQRPDAAAGIVAVAAKAAQTAGTQIVTWVYGDSVGDFLSEYFRFATEQQFGQTGWGCHALQAFVSGGAAITAAASRYDISMTGSVVTVPSAGKAVYSVAGGVRSFTAAAVWLETGPSMGTCKIEIVAADGTTVLATVSASTNCFNVIQSFVKITWTGSVTNGKLLVTGLSGNCTVISQYFGGSAASGVQQWLYTTGGITAGGVGAVALASMYDMIAYAQPDVFWYTNRESAALVDAYNGPIILQYRALRPNATIVICGVWAVFGEDVAGDTTSNSWLENERLRYFATQSQAVFVDALKVFPTFAAIRLLDPVYDGTHINVACRMALVSHLEAATGMLSVYGSPEWRSVSNALTRTQNLAVTAVVGLQDAVNVTCDNSADAYVKIRRWMFFKDAANSSPDALRVYATSGNGQAVMMNSGTAFASISGNYDANGQWVLVVHQTTGVATIYGRVNGTLKTLTLGTLA